LAIPSRQRRAIPQRFRARQTSEREVGARHFPAEFGVDAQRVVAAAVCAVSTSTIVPTPAW